MAAKLALLVGTILVIVATCSAPLIYHSRFENRQAAAFAALGVGSSKAELLRRAGEPTYVTDGTRWVEPEYPKHPDHLIPGCIEEYWYHSAFILIPSRWSYCLDQSGVILSKFHWASW